VDDGGIKDALVKLDDEKLSAQDVTGADGIYAVTGPDGVHLGLEAQEEPSHIVPFDDSPGYVRFAGGCWIDSANVNATHSGQVYIRTTTANCNAKRILLKFEKPVLNTSTTKIKTVLLPNVFQSARFRADSYARWNPLLDFNGALIIEDFAFTGASCATWATKPVTGSGIAGLMGIQAYNFSLGVTNTYLGTYNGSPYWHVKTDAINTAGSAAYGVELSVAIGPTANYAGYGGYSSCDIFTRVYTSDCVVLCL
jgi:hypothetical protein